MTADMSGFPSDEAAHALARTVSGFLARRESGPIEVSRAHRDVAELVIAVDEPKIRADERRKVIAEVVEALNVGYGVQSNVAARYLTEHPADFINRLAREGKL